MNEKKIEPTQAMVDIVELADKLMVMDTRDLLRYALNHPDAPGLFADEDATDARVPFLFRMGSALVPKDSTIFQDGDLVYAAVEDANIVRVEDVLAAAPQGD